MAKYIIWLENIVRFSASAYVNPSNIYALELDDNMDLNRRLYYPFDNVDMISGNPGEIIGSVIRNWRKFMLKASKDFDKDAVLLFPFTSMQRDFLNGVRQSGVKFEFKEIVCIQNNDILPRRKVVDMVETGAKNIWTVYKTIKALDPEELEKIVENNKAERAKPFSKSMLSRSDDVAIKKRYVNYEFMDIQLAKMADKLGFRLERNEGMLKVQTMIGDFVIGVANRPMSIYRYNDGEQSRLNLNSQYSPLEALIAVKSLERNEVKRVEDSIESDKNNLDTLKNLNYIR